MMMIDVQCKCGKRFGWSGRFADRPECPRCGDRPPQEELEAVDHKIDEDRRRAMIDPTVAAASVLRQQRIDAGLTLRQAARKLRVTPSDLSAIERGDWRPSENLAASMRLVYQGLDVEDKV